MSRWLCGASANDLSQWPRQKRCCQADVVSHANHCKLDAQESVERTSCAGVLSNRGNQKASDRRWSIDRTKGMCPVKPFDEKVNAERKLARA
jgi:hypothetical protein